MIRRSARLAPALATLLLTGATAGPAPAAPAETVAIVTSVQPLAFLLDELGGERLSVRVLVPAGASPHTFDPAPRDVARLARARAFVRVGGGFDDWALRLAAAAPAEVERVALLELRRTSAAVSGGPHAWLDPVLVRDAIAPDLADLLARIDPAGEGEYRARQQAFGGRLAALDAEIRALLAGAPGRRYVAFHNAWRHFARRYGLEEVGVVEEFAGEQPTPRELAALVDAARDAAVPAILVEPQLDPRLARVIAGEFDGGTVTVDPLGDPATPGRDGYEALMRFNASAFASALGGSAE